MGASYSKEVSPHQWHFVRDSKADRTIENFRVKKMEGFQYALVGGHWNGEAGDGLIRSVVFYVNSVGNIFNSLWLILN